MPYKEDGSDVPAPIQKMPAKRRRQFAHVWNGAYESCTADGGDKKTCEGKAYAEANAVVRRSDEVVTLSRSKLQSVFGFLRFLLTGQPTEEDRAVELGFLYESVHEQIEALNETQARLQLLGGMGSDGIDTKDWAFVTDLYTDEQNNIFALITQSGKLYQVPISVSGNDVTLGPWTEVTVEFAPVPRSLSSFIRIQRADGMPTRWFMITSTTVINRQGEINSAQLVDNMIRRASESNHYPYLTFFHLKEPFRVGQADYLARDEAVYIASGTFDDSPLAQDVIRALETQGDFWGASNSFYAISAELFKAERGIQIPIYTDGTHEEISILPEKYACSLFTGKFTINSEVSRMNEKVLEALKLLAGGDETKLAEFVARVDDINRAVNDEHLIHRAEDDNGADTTEVETTPVTASTDEDHTLILSDELLTELAQRVTEQVSLHVMESIHDQFEALKSAQSLNLAGINATLETQEAQLRSLLKPANERAHELAADLPKRTTTLIYRPSERSETEQITRTPSSYADIAAATLADLK